jgi:hypothetical protein
LLEYAVFILSSGDNDVTEGPVENASAAQPVESVQASSFSIARIAIALVVILLLAAAFVLPATRSAREPARRTLCLNRMQLVARALLQYESVKGTLPPAYTVDDEGRPLHSWRTLILPFLEQQKLYEAIDLTKPWDDSVNAMARETVVDAFTCPSASGELGLTTYLAVTGPHCAFNGAEPRALADVKDGAAFTIFVVDVPSDDAVPWMSPRDIDVDALAAYDAETKTQHGTVRLAAFLDGRVHPLSKESSGALVRALATIDEGEDLSEWSE